MPYTARDATKHTRRARSPKAKRQWSKVAESMRKRGYSEGAAVRAANGVIKKRVAKRKKARR